VFLLSKYQKVYVMRGWYVVYSPQTVNRRIICIAPHYHKPIVYYTALGCSAAVLLGVEYKIINVGQLQQWLQYCSVNTSD